MHARDRLTTSTRVATGPIGTGNATTSELLLSDYAAGAIQTVRVPVEQIADMLLSGKIDARALVEEFFGSDPEFGRMAGRFQALLDEQRGGADAETESAREREAFDRARMAAELPIKARAAALVWALAGLFAWFIALLTWNEQMGFRNLGVLIGVCFILGAVVCFSASFFVTPESRWRALVGLDDETLKSVRYRGRSNSG